MPVQIQSECANAHDVSNSKRERENSKSQQNVIKFHFEHNSKKNTVVSHLQSQTNYQHAATNRMSPQSRDFLVMTFVLELSN